MYSKIEISPSNFFIFSHSSFNVSVEFRTYFTDGLVFYVTNEKQSEFVTVQMIDSMITMSYTDKGQKTTDVITPGNYNDGLWHKVTTVFQ